MRLSNEAIARQSGVRGPTVARVLEGESCGIKTLWAIADALNIRRESLIDFKLKEHQFPAAVVNGKRR